MSSQPATFISQEEYLQRERLAERKSEYFRGEMFARAGATPEHAAIVTNLVGNPWLQLRGKPCRTYSTGLRLRVTPAGLYT